MFVTILSSTINAKVAGAILPNFSANDFNTNYTKKEEFENYNRPWAPEDYTFYENERLEVVTNLAITANQKMGRCPNSPYLIGAICDPNHNHCEAGGQGKLGVMTGECVAGDYPHWNKTTNKWDHVNVCEINGNLESI